MLTDGEISELATLAAKRGIEVSLRGGFGDERPADLAVPEPV